MLTLAAGAALSWQDAPPRATQAQPLAIEVPASAGQAQCRLGGPESAVALEPGARLRLACPATGTVVSCDFQHAEPIDVLAEAVCSSKAIPLRESVPVALTTLTPGPARVDWLDVSTDGSIQVVASRSVLLERTVVQVSRSPSRFVRVTLEGHSPVSVAAAAMRRDHGMPVARQKGGELFVAIVEALVQPRQFDVLATGRHLVNGGRAASLSGIPPGDYWLEPVYEGGLRGRRAPVRITSGESTHVAFVPEPVGQLSITADPQLCGVSSAIHVGGPSGAVRLPHHNQCDRVIAGLAPGPHAVALWGEHGPIIERTVRIGAQRREVVRFDSPVASISGEVRLNGEHIPGFVVELHRLAQPGQPLVVPVTNGYYGSIAGEPGPYVGYLKDGRRTTQRFTAQRRFDLLQGDNRIDWNERAAVVDVDIENWDRRHDVQITLQGTDGLFGGEPIRVPSDTSEVSPIVGLPFGRYRLQATELTAEQPKSSAMIPVELTETTWRRHVTLRLEHTSLRLSVRDDRGRPIDSPAIPGKRLDAGVYLVSVPPGTNLTIRAPRFSPVCRTVPAGTTFLDVQLTAGRPYEVWIAGAGPGEDPLAQIVPPGSDCPISLRLLQFQFIGMDQEGHRRFLFSDFPAGGPLGIRWRTGETLAVPLPGNGPLILRPPKER